MAVWQGKWLHKLYTQLYMCMFCRGICQFLSVLMFLPYTLKKPEQEMSAPLLSSSLLIKLYQVAEL